MDGLLDGAPAVIGGRTDELNSVPSEDVLDIQAHSQDRFIHLFNFNKKLLLMLFTEENGFPRQKRSTTYFNISQLLQSFVTVPSFFFFFLQNVLFPSNSNGRRVWNCIVSTSDMLSLCYFHLIMGLQMSVFGKSSHSVSICILDSFLTLSGNRVVQWRWKDGCVYRGEAAEGV